MESVSKLFDEVISDLNKIISSIDEILAEDEANDEDLLYQKYMEVSEHENK